MSMFLSFAMLAASAAPIDTVAKIEGKVSISSGENPNQVRVWAVELGVADENVVKGKCDDCGKFELQLTVGKKYLLLYHAGRDRTIVPAYRTVEIPKGGLANPSETSIELEDASHSTMDRERWIASSKVMLKLLPAGKSPAVSEYDRYLEDLRQRIEDRQQVSRRRTTILIPAYFSDGAASAEWAKLFSAAHESKTELRIVAVINPASGPGKVRDPGYAKIIESCRQNGIVVLGYVAQNYGKREAEAIEKDIDLWIEHYTTIDGYFFDEMPSDEKHHAFRRRASAYARTALRKASTEEAFLVGNMGASPKTSRILKDKVVDNLIVFEGAAEFDRFRFSDWAWERGQVTRTSILLYRTDKEKMQKAVRRLLVSGCDTFYVTDASADRPDVKFGLQWGRLPKYWDDFVKAAKSK